MPPKKKKKTSNAARTGTNPATGANLPQIKKDKPTVNKDINISHGVPIDDPNHRPNVGHGVPIDDPNHLDNG